MHIFIKKLSTNLQILLSTIVYRVLLAVYSFTLFANLVDSYRLAPMEKSHKNSQTNAEM